MSIYKGTQLISGVATPIEPTRNVGQIIQSLLPLTDAGLHLLDGTVISGNGIYKAFVDYIKTLDLTANYFTTEADWQQSVTTYGVCGKFVYNASANTVRLPKVTGFVEGTIDPSALGDLVEAGLPNITGGAGAVIGADSYVDGAFYGGEQIGAASGVASGWGFGRSYFDASLSNPIYDNSNTVQPQSILGYMYIVVATTTKTDIEVDIDNVVTDLNGKVDVSSMVDITDAGSTITSLVIPDYTAGISFTWGTDFTAPSNGIIMLGRNGYGGATAAYYWTINNGNRHCFGGNNSGVFQMVIPVSKDDVLTTVGGNNDAGNYSYFYPMKGDN